MKRVLFVSEAVTLAQVVRLKTLADALDPQRWEIHFASARFDDLIFRETSFHRWPIHSIDDADMRSKALKGSRLYDEPILERYIDEERELIQRVKPDVIIGDLRWSLAVSAPLEKVPHASLINAYWCRASHHGRFPLPDHPTARWLGPGIAGMFFPLARPLVFALHARPLNRLRKRYGLPALGSLDDILTHGDFALFPDVPGLVPLSRRKPSERYLGPVLWAPRGSLPPWWDEVDGETIYVTLGSSGRAEKLAGICKGLEASGVTLLVATAGLTESPPGARSASYLPGDLASRRSTIVVCNGGSTTAYQALAEGVPVLGIPSNLDQYLSMRAIENAGAGICIRADRASPRAVRAAAVRLRTEPGFRAAAGKLKEEFASFCSAERFREFLKEAIC